MLKRKGTYLHLVRICLGLLFLCLVSTSTFARQIALFYDPIFVDINDGNIFAEASNLKASLELLGHEVILFTDFDVIQGADFDLVIIPELEKKDLAQSLSSSQFNIYKNYVEDGGAIIIMSVVSNVEFQGNNAVNFINEIIGSNMQVGGPILDGTCIKNSNIISGEFASAPDEINNNNAVVYIQPNLPNGAKVLYHHEEDSTQAAVAEFKVGEGSLVYFGWGWWNAIPYGSQDGGWLSLLEITIETLSCDQPELHLDDNYEFSLELSSKFTLTEDDFPNSYLACTGASLSFSQSEFGCGDIDKDLTIEVSLTDELERVVKQNITIVILDLHEVCDLQPQSLQLTGNIQIMNGNPLKNAELTLAAEYTQTAISDENGLITISHLDKDIYDVNLHKEAILAKEVTSHDLTLLLRHVLRLESFTLPYQYLAADLNGDKILDIQDIALIRALILNLDTEGMIPSNWLWVEKDYSFDNDAQSPLQQDWDTIQGSTLDLESLQLQIIGVKIGDIDSSYQD